MKKGFIALFLVPVLFFMTGCGAAKENVNMDTTTQEKQAPERTVATMHTNYGEIRLKLFNAEAPKTVENFVKLSNEGFYNETKFHRVIKDFMIQGGDPNSKLEDRTTHGRGGPGYTFEDEINEHKLVRGTLAMANAGPNTNGSQFFVVTAESTPWLDGRHTAFGEVVAGMEVVEMIENLQTDALDNPVSGKEAVIEKITIE